MHSYYIPDGLRRELPISVYSNRDTELGVWHDTQPREWEGYKNIYRDDKERIAEYYDAFCEGDPDTGVWGKWELSNGVYMPAGRTDARILTGFEGLSAIIFGTANSGRRPRSLERLQLLGAATSELISTHNQGDQQCRLVSSPDTLLALRHNMHYDIVFLFAKIAESAKDPLGTEQRFIPVEKRYFGLSHTTYGPITAALMGYAEVIGMDRSEQEELFLKPALELFGDLEHGMGFGWSANSLMGVASGEHYHHQRNLNGALCNVIPLAPGAERGTEFLQRDGKFVFRQSYLPFHSGSDPNRPPLDAEWAIERQDIPRLIRMVYAASAGEGRDDIKRLLDLWQDETRQQNS